MNFEVGAWIRKETNLDTLHEIQQKFRLVPIENENEKSSIITQTTAPFGADMTPKSIS